MGKNKGRSLCSLRPRFFTETSSFLSLFSAYGAAIITVWRECALKECTSHEKNGEKDEKKSGAGRREKGGPWLACARFLSLERLVVYDQIS